MATLYIVATPIGNLEDITLRALRILKEVDLIACEDTRTTKKLLSTYDIKTPTTSYHVHSTSAKQDKLIALLEEGKDIALVSDAGTPTISDPGVLLVETTKRTLGERIEIVPIPGSSALLAALSAGGLPASDFLFLGFLPHKKGRETLFKEIEASRRTVVLYESPHRILKTLASLALVLSEDRKVVIARELTKIHEEIITGSAGVLLKHFEESPETVRGEFVVLVEGK